MSTKHFWVLGSDGVDISIITNFDWDVGLVDGMLMFKKFFGNVDEGELLWQQPHLDHQVLGENADLRIGYLPFNVDEKLILMDHVGESLSGDLHA